jgi:hypothetical protein
MSFLEESSWATRVNSCSAIGGATVNPCCPRFEESSSTTHSQHIDWSFLSQSQLACSADTQFNILNDTPLHVSTPGTIAIATCSARLFSPQHVCRSTPQRRPNIFNSTLLASRNTHNPCCKTCSHHTDRSFLRKNSHSLFCKSDRMQPF